MIAMLLLVFMAGTSMFFVSLSNTHGDLKETQENIRDMVEIKQALIAYATNFADLSPSYGLGPGRLPCPDRNLNGKGNNKCENFSDLLAHLPEYRTTDGVDFIFSDTNVDLGTYEELHAELQFWYAVSADYTYNPSYTLNSSISGQYSLDGVSDYVAIIIAPGDELANIGQDRDGGANNHKKEENFLEGSNESGLNFINSYPDDPEAFNDRVIGISRKELMTQVTSRVAREVKNHIDSYHNSNSFYPSSSNFDSAMSSAPSWFDGDEWDLITTYTRNSGDSASVTFDDCDITYNFDYDPSSGSYLMSRSGNTC